MWHLLDILQYCGDAGEYGFRVHLESMLTLTQEECDAALALWLIEELLDSQSIDGCRKVFEYLESRREKLVAVSPVA